MPILGDEFGHRKSQMKINLGVLVAQIVGMFLLISFVLFAAAGTVVRELPSFAGGAGAG